MRLAVAVTFIFLSCREVPHSVRNRVTLNAIVASRVMHTSEPAPAAKKPAVRVASSTSTRHAAPARNAEQGMQLQAAKHQPEGTAAQARIVIPDDWRKAYPFSERFPDLRPADAAHHVIDLAAMRFETDDLVSVSTSGQRRHSMPDLATFPRELTTFAFEAGADDYFIVQAKTAADQTSLRSWLQANGIPILDYLPQFAYLVRASQEQFFAIEQRPEVFWTGQYSPAFRVDPLLDFVIQANPAQRIQIRALFDAARYKELQPLLDRLTELGLTEAKHARRSRDWSIRVEGTAATARAIALLPGCLWVERYVAPKINNNIARTSQNVVTGRGASNGPIMDVEDVWARGIRGEGQIASAADTGLSTGNLATLHQDFGQQGSATNPLRVLAGFALGRAGNWNDDQAAPMEGGHGTHTSGSIVGNGFRSGSSPSTNTFPTTSYAGTAPKAQFVFQSIMDSNGGLDGLPLNLNALFQQTYDAGARVHSNSWGADVNGAYNTDSQEVDQFSWRNKDMVITFSAGNSGDDTSFPGPVDGIINRDSTGAPGTAKNCITVGASENYLPSFVYEYPAGDCTSSDGIEQRTWGWFDHSSNGRAPIFGDLMTDNANGLAAFSSRGPTDDGRFKPDVVAPGVGVISTRTEVHQAYEQWGVCSIPGALQPYYMTEGGTSMANPLTAGAATLVRQYYVDGWHPNNSVTTNMAAVPANGFNPSSALVKATLINGAWDMAPGQYGTGAAREIPPSWDTGATLPNNAEGFGRVDLETALFPGSGFSDASGRQAKVHDVTPGLATGQSSNFTFDIVGNGDPLIVTLVWTDPQAATGAGVKLVNNLDLTVTAPGGGTTYFPNGIDKTSGVDSLNNVEQVKVSNPPSGQWSITVAGTSVPGNAELGSTTQPFALVISGESCPSVPPSGVTATASGPNHVTVNWSAASGSPVSYRIYRSGPGSSCPVSGYSLIATVSAPTVTYDDFTASGGSTYSYKVSAVDASCESALSSCSSATPTGACTLPPSFAGLTGVATPTNATCTLDLTWSAAAASCSGAITYNVYRSSVSGFSPAGSNRIASGVSGTSYSDINVAAGTLYYYKVRASENGIEDTNSAQQGGTAAGITTTFYTQNFDALPTGDMAGFTTSGTGLADWRGVMTCAPHQSAGNVFRFGGNGCTMSYGNSEDTQAVINGAAGLVIPAGTVNTRLSFAHRYDFESAYDGGLIRIQRQGDAAFTDVPGAAILAGGYNDFDAVGRSVWGGNFNTTMTSTVVDLDAACNAIPGNTGGCAGQTIFVAFAVYTDFSEVRAGWSIDDVSVTYQTCVACTPPGAPSGLTVTTPSANTAHLEWAAGIPAGTSYSIYRETGGCPAVAPALIASGITATSYDDTGLSGGTSYKYVVRAVSASGCESGNSACQNIGATGAILPPPPGFTATATSGTVVAITWGPVAGAIAYDVERSVNNATFTPVGISSGSVMIDSGRAPDTSYMYRAFARTSTGSLSTSSKDVATTTVFTDNPTVAGTTIIKADHVTQLRTAVNAMLTLAGPGPAAYTDPTITPGTTPIRQLHITQLRTNLDNARSLLGLAAPVYTDPTITGSTLIKSAHVDELRNAVK